MPFGNEEEILDQLVAEAHVRARAPDGVVANIRQAADRSLRSHQTATLAMAVFAGFVAGALWKL